MMLRTFHTVETDVNKSWENTTFKGRIRGRGFFLKIRTIRSQLQLSFDDQGLAWTLFVMAGNDILEITDDIGNKYDLCGIFIFNFNA